MQGKNYQIIDDLYEDGDEDGYDIPLNNYKEKKFKKTAIKQTKGKGKFI